MIESLEPPVSVLFKALESLESCLSVSLLGPLWPRPDREVETALFNRLLAIGEHVNTLGGTRKHSGSLFLVVSQTARSNTCVGFPLLLFVMHI